ncbi:hypothetical protein LINPERHAP1_LOCUS31958 [Linum perenne]
MQTQLLVIIFIIIITIKITGIESGGNQACLPPGPDGTFNLACSRRHPILPISLLIRKKYLLDYTRYGLLIGYPFTDFCATIHRSGEIGRKMYSYASCSYDIDSCDLCLQSAIEIIRNNCKVSANGAQASSEGCCIRYEYLNPFCTPTP